MRDALIRRSIAVHKSRKFKRIQFNYRRCTMRQKRFPRVLFFQSHHPNRERTLYLLPFSLRMQFLHPRLFSLTKVLHLLITSRNLDVITKTRKSRVMLFLFVFITFIFSYIFNNYYMHYSHKFLYMQTDLLFLLIKIH